MSKYQWISVLGLWVIVFPFFGFPIAWSKWIAVVTGLIIIAIAYRGASQARRAESSRATPYGSPTPFVQNSVVPDSSTATPPPEKIAQ